MGTFSLLIAIPMASGIGMVITSKNVQMGEQWARLLLLILFGVLFKMAERSIDRLVKAHEQAHPYLMSLALGLQDTIDLVLGVVISLLSFLSSVDIVSGLGGEHYTIMQGMGYLLGVILVICVSTRSVRTALEIRFGWFKPGTTTEKQKQEL